MTRCPRIRRLEQAERNLERLEQDLPRIKAESQIELLDRLAADCIGGLEFFELEAEANRIRELHGLPFKDYDNDEYQEVR